jgi:hypothetical protein
MHVAQKFEHLLDAYRLADGHKWTGAQLDEAQVVSYPAPT